MPGTGLAPRKATNSDDVHTRMGDVLKHPMHDDKNSFNKEKEKPHKDSQSNIDSKNSLVFGEADTRSKVDADDSLSQPKRSAVGTGQQSDRSNRLHTVAAAPRSAIAGHGPPKKDVKVHFPRYFINKARMHESKHRRPLQPTRRRREPDSFKFGT